MAEELKYMLDTYNIVNNLKNQFKKDGENKAQFDDNQHLEKIENLNKKNRGD